jgi:hypothetical protein
MNFLLSILSSIIGGLILVVATAVVSERARWVLTAALARLLDIDVEYVFPNPRAAERDLSRELAKSRCVQLFTGRGNEMQRESFATLLGSGTPRATEVRILLPCTEHVASGLNWIEDRESELAVIDPAFGQGTLREQIRTTARFLRPLVVAGRVELRRFDFPHLGRILITDRCAYLTPYPSDAHGRDSRVVKYRRSGDMYEFLERTFQKIWNDSHEDIWNDSHEDGATGCAPTPGQ